MEDCLFCDMASGNIPLKEILYEDDTVFAIDNISPQAPVHVLLIPKNHYDNILENLDASTLEALHAGIKEVAKIKGLNVGGFRVITNAGKDAGQTVKHLHFHILGGEPLSEKMC